MTGWVQIYDCLCSDSANDETALPAACPGHGFPRNQPVRAPGQVPERHECAGRICHTTTTATYTADRGAP